MSELYHFSGHRLEEVQKIREGVGVEDDDPRESLPAQPRNLIPCFGPAGRGDFRKNPYDPVTLRSLPATEDQILLGPRQFAGIDLQGRCTKIRVYDQMGLAI